MTDTAVVSVPDPGQAAADAAAALAATSPPPVTSPVTPADFVYTLTLPKDAALEASAVERHTAFAKAEKLSPETAQKALEQENTAIVADRAKQGEATASAFQTLARETWPNEIKADKEFGGDKFDATVLESKRAADKFVTADEKEMLNKSGWGNHPVLVRIMARVGRAMGNDTLVVGGAGVSGAKKTDGQVLYPGMNP